MLSLLRMLGEHMCHQMPERTLTAGDWSAVLCFRCSAFHTAFMLAAVGQLLWARRRTLSLPLAAVAVASLALLTADIVVWKSTNWQRVVTGALAGTGTAAIAVPLMLGMASQTPSAFEPIGRARMTIFPVALATSLALHGLSSCASVWASSILSVSGAVALWFAANAIIVARITSRLRLAKQQTTVYASAALLLVAEVAAKLILTKP